jgi:hypothetical protein
LEARPCLVLVDDDLIESFPLPAQGDYGSDHMSSAKRYVNRAPQQRLYFRPLPQGHSALRPL